MTTSAEIREKLVDALRLDLVGPEADDKQRAEEILDTAPGRFYLTGFLIPYDSEARDRADETVADEIEEVGRSGEEDEDSDKVSTRRGYFPSSMGLTLLVPETVNQVNAVVRWADYIHEPPTAVAEAGSDPVEQSEGHDVYGRWRRVPQRREVALNVADHKTIPVVDSNGLELVTAMRDINDSRGLNQRARAFSVYVVNRRTPQTGITRDAANAFQVSLTVECYHPLVPRPNPRGRFQQDPDEQTADIQFRNVVQYAVGHNVAIKSEVIDDACKKVHTEWMPRAEVLKVDHKKIAELKAEMAVLGQADAATITTYLSPLIDRFATYLGEQQAKVDQLEEYRRRHAEKMVRDAERIKQRMLAGLALLSDETVLTAFRIANRAVAAAFLRREGIKKGVTPRKMNRWLQEPDVIPVWRPFQIGFILMNLNGLVDPNHMDRETVDLLFFPTGGGKTEAYLGLAAFTLALRRLRTPGPESGGLTVLMRYTLRLLTLDQMDRATALICALEMERREGPDAEKLGTRPFEIGLWVGQGATPNRLGKVGKYDKHSARFKVDRFKEKDKRYGSPVPMQACSWCGEPFGEDSFELWPDKNNPTDLRLLCFNKKCDFQPSTWPTGLPVISVDEPLYRRLPCFLIATADKFAGLPWLADTGKLFGKVSRHHKDGGYTGHEGGRGGDKLPGPLPPPDLIIQDELHLISGPLGTMVGLYETAVEALMMDTAGYRPKIVASTATVRRAEKQIQGLFARNHVDVFPPPGLDYRYNFFSEVDEKNHERARLYLGVAAQGRSLKVVLMRCYLVLLAAAQKLWLAEGGAENEDNPVDPYMTLLGYFNALRELGGSRRIVEDEITSRLTTYSERKRVGEVEGSFADRHKLRVPVELTSRESTSAVAFGKQCLATPFRHKDSIDVALASNMISVGLDIERLGLMVVLGQPKTAAEYIQATSRVGRNPNRPGLVVTLLNIHRPRDRSHYESFSFWHSCFYRSVEVNSVTPFSARALDRGLAAVVVALARHLVPELTPSSAAGRIGEFRAGLTERISGIISDRARRHTKMSDTDSTRLTRFLENRVANLLQTWESMAADRGLDYQNETKSNSSQLLHSAGRKSGNTLTAEEEQFKIQWSLREVEPKVNLFLNYPKGYGKENT